MRNCSPQHSSPRSASTSVGSTQDSPEKSAISRTNTWVLHHAANNANTGKYLFWTTYTINLFIYKYILDYGWLVWFQSCD